MRRPIRDCSSTRCRHAIASWAIGCGLLLGLLATHPLPARADAGACVEAHADAQRSRLRGELLHARDQLITCAQASCPALISNDCASWLSEVEANLPSVVFAVTDSAGGDVVEVTISSGDRVLATRADGRAVSLDPGPYELKFQADGFAPLTVSITARQAEKNRIVAVRLEPPAAELTSEAGGIPTLSYVLGGVALASLGTGVALGIYGSNEYDHAEGHCAPGCSEDQVAAGKRAYLIADVAFGVGIASAVTAVIVYFAAQPSEDAGAPAIGVAASRDGAAVLWTATY